MEHRLISEIRKALGWEGGERLGREFARGTLGDLEVCSRFLTPQRMLDIIMRRSMSAHRVQALQDGRHLPEAGYIDHLGSRRGESPPIVNMSKLGALIKEGVTLVVDRAQAYDATLEVACRAMQWWVRELTYSNLYLTTGEAQGFRRHWDDHDVLILQVAGQKGWKVWGPSREAPMFRDVARNDEAPDEVVWAGTMQPGDVMHIPRGWWHQATREEAGEGFSLHVTFSITKRTPIAYLRWLADRALEDVELRRDLPRGVDCGAWSRALEQRVMDLVRVETPARFLAARELEARPGRHVEAGVVFGDPRTLVCVTEFPPSVQRRGDEVVITAGGTETVIRAESWPAMERLLSGHPVVLDEVAAETGANVARLAEVAMRHGLCAEATPELLAGYTGLVA